MAYMISHVTGNKTAIAHSYSSLCVLQGRTPQQNDVNLYSESFYLNHQWGLSFFLASESV